MKSVENWLYDWAMNVEGEAAGRQGDVRQIDRQAQRMMKVSTPTICLTTSWAANPTNRINDNDDGDGNDDDIDEARFGYTDEQPQMMQHRLEPGRVGRGVRGDSSASSSSSSPSWVVYLVLFGFGLAFWSSAASLWIDAQSFGWMKSVWELLGWGVRQEERDERNEEE